MDVAPPKGTLDHASVRVTEERVVVYVPNYLYQDLREWAHGDHVSLSQLARGILERAVTRRGKG